MISLIKKAVIPAAGMGTRFLPATKAQPKEMLPIVDKPTIQFVVEEAAAAGIEEILIITGRNKQAIEDHFDRNPELEDLLRAKGKEEELKEILHISNLANICYMRQKEPLGLGHAVLCARSFIGNEPFAVLLGDDVVHAPVPCIKQLIDVYAAKGQTVLGTQRVGWENVHKYGIIDTDDPDATVVRVKQLTEKPSRTEAASDLAVLGRYIIEPDIFPILEQTAPGRGGEIQLTDGLNTLAARQPVWAHNFDGRRYDVGDRLGFLEATLEYALRREDLAPALKRFLSSLQRR
ncbi:MAG: UTP--glucose-1-phosphate uridylyltransferase GalU [Bacillota bacterium]|nr:UTP--glucose-1-phosphate uridylyltransferase GalU [Bacillota bacterium]